MHLGDKKKSKGFPLTTGVGGASDDYQTYRPTAEGFWHSFYWLAKGGESQPREKNSQCVVESGRASEKKCPANRHAKKGGSKPGQTNVRRRRGSIPAMGEERENLGLNCKAAAWFKA